MCSFRVMYSRLYDVFSPVLIGVIALCAIFSCVIAVIMCSYLIFVF